MEIAIDTRQKRIDIDPDALQRKTELILEGLGCDSSTAVSIVLVGNEEMAELNFKYRGKEGPTNVLSFSQTEGGNPGGQQNLLGDVVICADRAADDAAELGYSDDEMVLYLLIHGILHLVGYDHKVSTEAEAMEAKVERIFLQILGETESTEAQSRIRT